MSGSALLSSSLLESESSAAGGGSKRADAAVDEGGVGAAMAIGVASEDGDGDVVGLRPGRREREG